MTRQFKHRECTRCHDRPAQRSSVLCAQCATGERVEEPWDLWLAYEAVLRHVERTGSPDQQSAAAFVREHAEHLQREMSKAKHPSGRGQ